MPSEPTTADKIRKLMEGATFGPELAAVVEAAERLPVIHDRRCRHHWFAPTSCDCGAADDRQELDKALAALASKMKETERAN